MLVKSGLWVFYASSKAVYQKIHHTNSYMDGGGGGGGGEILQLREYYSHQIDKYTV